MTKKSFVALLGVAAAAAVLVAPAAHAAASVYVQVGPSPYYPAYTQPGYVVTGPRYYAAPQPYYGNGYHQGYRHTYRRDQDRDGIPNRWDRDRDGDGVPNRFDRRPSNPYRR